MSLTIQLAAAVQHHPSRAALIPGLLAGLDGLDVQVVEDPGGDRPDTWRTHRACLEAMPEGASHLLVLQDDAALCQQFAGNLLAAVAERPEAIIALFVPGFPFLARRIEQHREKGEMFAVLPAAAFTPVVAIVYPRTHVEGLLAHTDGSRWPRARQLGTADDAVVAGYVRGLRLSVLATVPSLVDHRDDVPSVAKPSHRAGRHRRAALFAGSG
jgi:hypothetical protein